LATASETRLKPRARFDVQASGLSGQERGHPTGDLGRALQQEQVAAARYPPATGRPGSSRPAAARRLEVDAHPGVIVLTPRHGVDRLRADLAELATGPVG
jgi:hypothetical protein